ncbi:nuclear transport factor 2 family protein [Bradyrhizobium sp. 180]|uniref:nuclear transport factor 2 family protein n=1 Tax=unclassified Bradyrhizobium TaxID=2631580 RepID=UPI001FFC0580|nr:MULTISPECIES: nuclear transport factor 2 family protein [unclassified Bradyrhizobium]MCK1423164.1 nuclear transport factor 2 family protein [Bradyrhizobium sp. CW12]MCK1492984.1 nuclear transport factor 2 family protein [Bradyrhizobium sp. 180]MCK1531287.1 nuclear transport factor 2 family protein [Bradyrhizobium sp. 182]MCK1599150.1 nuclear transport factor 2 family protein [Bradyrhizobium sp. 164]MCK1645098.1 nuclear transport factor 2 family protein [Bradyrhizobium sp. 154]
MPSRDIVEAFAQRLEAGDFIGAIEQFCAPDAVTYENSGAPTVGRDKLIAKERGVLAASKEVKAVRIGPSLIEGDHVATRWCFSFTNADGITRTLDEVAWQTWRGDQLIEERFYYDPKQLGR